MTNQSGLTGTVATLYPVSFKEGFSVQDQFTEAMHAAGYEVSPASAWEDKRDHIDVWAWIDGAQYGIDIKGMKRLSRYGEQQNKYTCLELHGAHQKNRGWLYGGKADLIAFEQEDSYLLVWRRNLITLAEFVVGREQVRYSSQAVYKIYSRRDHEQITWIETALLRNSWLLFLEVLKTSNDYE